MKHICKTSNINAKCKDLFNGFESKNRENSCSLAPMGMQTLKSDKKFFKSKAPFLIFSLHDFDAPNGAEF